MDDLEQRMHARDRGGARSVWLAGLAGLAGFLVLSPLLSLVATLMVWGANRRTGPLSEANGRAALDWQLSYLALQMMLVPLHLALVSAREDLSFPWPVVTIWALVAIGALNVLVSVVGAVRAHRGGVLRVPLTPGFLGSAVPPRPWADGRVEA